MAQKSNIQWTDASWNVARGCSKVDEDCKFCYMYRDSFDSTRYNPLEVVRTKTVFDMPLKLKEPSKIFTCSLTDFYHEAIDSYRDEAWDIIRRCPQHTFQILTKRPERIIQHTPPDLLMNKNIWFGTSVGSVKGISRIRTLLDVPCAVRFVSFEPLHERLDIKFNVQQLMDIHWVIIGGESGNETGKYRYRPCQLAWIDMLIYTFKPHSAIFVKQMGTYLSKKIGMSDRHGGNFDEFPEHFKIRNFPKV